MRKKIIFFFLDVLAAMRSVLSSSENAYKMLLAPRYENFRFCVGQWKAWRVFEHARRTVPAYSTFLNDHGFKQVVLDGLTPRLADIPPMDKESYIKKYSIESRCQGGEIPSKGVVVDESSGTSGMPNNWVRGKTEREAVKLALQTAVHSLLGEKKIFFINAFALGPWATGMNVSMSLVDIVIMKSTGPDISKIENTLNFFGPSYTYIIAGYPPFLKTLVDSKKVAWEKYDLIAFFGGEGISENGRAYLGKAFKKAYSSYGASDLEINIGSENDFTIALRQHLLKNPALRAELTRHETLPMIFQYNPLDYHIETNDEGELLVTLCRRANIAPKVRYNIHDLGHVIRTPKLATILKSHGIKMKDLDPEMLDLPLLFHYGRADMSVAFYGCKITPTDMDEVILAVPELGSQINTFSLVTSEDTAMNKRLAIAIEMKEGLPFLTDHTKITKDILEKLKTVNQDFRESSHMIPAGFEPTVETYVFGTGPFVANDIRLKKRYIQTR